MKQEQGRFFLLMLLVGAFYLLGCDGSHYSALKSSQKSSDDSSISDGGDGNDSSGGTPSRDPAGHVDEPSSVAGFDPYYDVGRLMGEEVDNIYPKNAELLDARNEQVGHFSDSCDTRLEGKATFAERIAHAVETKMNLSTARLGYVSSYFGLSSNESSYLPNSLMSHQVCNVTRSTLETTLSGKNVPDSATIAKLNRFADEVNQHRTGALRGEQEAYRKVSQLWGKFFMCLSYMESLTTADTSRSQNVANKYAPSDYRRPAGVNFYEDPNQPAVSRLNIGLFQFTPNSGGNIQSCIREWNDVYPQCSIKRNEGQSELIRVLGSSMQTFNSFCAASKTTGMFSVQVNTTKAYNTHPYNIKADGSLKLPGERCVSPHMSVGRSYNHFGPFQNSSGFTLSTVMKCVYPN